MKCVAIVMEMDFRYFQQTKYHNCTYIFLEMVAIFTSLKFITYQSGKNSPTAPNDCSEFFFREIWPEGDCFGSAESTHEDELLLLREIFFTELESGRCFYKF